MLYHDKDRKRASKIKWTYREYHVQESKYVHHKSVKISRASTQFPALPFCGPHEKPHVLRGLSKDDHLRLNPRLVNGKCAVRFIPCSYNA